MIKELAKSTIHSPFEVKDIYTKGAKCVRLKVPPQWQVTIQFSAFFFPERKRLKSRCQALNRSCVVDYICGEEEGKKEKKTPLFIFSQFFDYMNLFVSKGIGFCCESPVANSETKPGSLSLSGLYDLFIYTRLCFEVSPSKHCVHVPAESALNTTRSPHSQVFTRPATR